MKTYIGIDNGSTGTIGTISVDGYTLSKVPIFTQQDYTKKTKSISRIATNMIFLPDNSFAIIERPMINPMRFVQSISAARALEAMLIVLDDDKIPYQFIDSKEWQKEFFPHVKRGEKQDTKALSLQVGKRLFPNIEGDFKDYDGLLIAEYARRKNL